MDIDREIGEIKSDIRWIREAIDRISNSIDTLREEVNKQREHTDKIAKAIEDEMTHRLSWLESRIDELESFRDKTEASVRTIYLAISLVSSVLALLLLGGV